MFNWIVNDPGNALNCLTLLTYVYKSYISNIYIYIYIYIYKLDLSLNNALWLMCDKTKPNQTKPNYFKK